MLLPFATAPLESLREPRIRGSLDCCWSHSDVSDIEDLFDAVESKRLPSGNEEGEISLQEAVGDDFVNDSFNAKDDDDEGFPVRVRSEMQSHSVVSDQEDFFDAVEDFSSDASILNIPSDGSMTVSELYTKFRIMHRHWERIRNLMSQAGVTFPAPPDNDDLQLDESSIVQWLQEVAVSRFIAEVVTRAQARSEAEAMAATIIESKDQEIIRLKDRLQYYVTVNDEMSQRKLEEVMLRQQQRKGRRRRQRWTWGFTGLAVSVAALCFAYPYIPSASRFLSSVEPGNSNDALSISSSDTS